MGAVNIILIVLYALRGEVDIKLGKARKAKEERRWGWMRCP
jgi:hypothetical protein